MLYLELLIQGIVQGSIYALIALGLTLVYGLLRILHVAHAALFTLGGYIGVIVTNQTGSLVLAMLVAAFLVGLVVLGRTWQLPPTRGPGSCRSFWCAKGELVTRSSTWLMKM